MVGSVICSGFDLPLLLLRLTCANWGIQSCTNWKAVLTLSNAAFPFPCRENGHTSVLGIRVTSLSAPCRTQTSIQF
ncbi:hypothetical protein HDV57DRAFT_496440 [Trichoderma longibrachiatum]